jgi:hypothetical protein
VRKTILMLPSPMILPPDNTRVSLEFERDHVGVWYDGAMFLKRRSEVWRSFVLELERERESGESDQKRHRRMRRG